MKETEIRAELINLKLKAYGRDLIKGYSVCSIHQTFAGQLDALRAETQKLEAVYQKKIDDVEELRKSILKKAFTGQLKTENLQTV